MAITPTFHRYSAFTSFLGFLDLKLGCTILTLFNLFNKSAGIFGLLAIFQGGTWAQLSLYAYSLGTIFLSLWGLRGISEESSPTVMAYAHLYLADHMISSIWSFYFFQIVYYYTEHNGQPPALSPYQAGLMNLIEQIESQYETKGVHHSPLEGQARVEAAQQVWKGESSFSSTVLAMGWLLKIYFALLLYSYGLHLRHGTYRSLPLSKPSQATTSANRNGYLPIRPSISIERGEGSAPHHQQQHPLVNGRSLGASARLGSLDEELPAWSDDEMDEEESMQQVNGSGRQHVAAAHRPQNTSSSTRAALDRLANTNGGGGGSAQ